MVVVGGLLLPAPAAGQARAAGAETKEAAPTKAWTPPMTPYGQPDLRGVWENKSATPLERPTELAGKPFLTDQEVAEITGQRADTVRVRMHRARLFVRKELMKLAQPRRARAKSRARSRLVLRVTITVPCLPSSPTTGMNRSMCR